MIADVNLKLHKEMKSARNINSMGENILLNILLLNILFKLFKR